MRTLTTPKIHELTATGGGKNPTVTPGASQQSVTFALNSLPAGKQQKFWYYATSIIVKVVTTFDQAASGGSAVNPDKLWKVIASMQLQCPILGELFPHRNTRGAVLGNIIQVMGTEFKQFPLNPQIASTDGDTTVTLFYRIPLGTDFLKKGHETAPWTGLLEGGTLEVKCDVSTVFDSDSPGAVIKAPTNFRAWIEMQPQPEAVVHTPVHWREYLIPGSSTKFTLLDMGAPDGLKGIDLSRGAGLPFLAWLANPTGIGLSGADTVDKITQLDINWRDQDRIEVPEAFMTSMYAMKGRNQYGAGADTGATIGNDNGWPFALGGTNHPTLMTSDAFFFPLIMPGHSLETSKMQTVKGARDINFAFSATPAAQSRFLSCEFPVFDQGFAQQIKDLLLGGPNPNASLAPKTLNKQVGGTHGVGKLAYVRQKVVA